MNTEWIDARADGSDLRVGDMVRLCRRVRDDSFLASVGVVIGLHATEIVTSGPRSWARDRTGNTYRWQYHAPTRAKLEAADRERVTVTSITSDAMTVRPAPPPDSEPGWDHVPAEHVPRGGISAVAPGDRYYVKGLGWHSATRQSTCMVCNDFHWIRRAAHPERIRWLEERNRAVNTDSAIVAAVNSTATYARAPSASTFPDECKPLMRFVPKELDPFAAVRAEAKRMLDAGANPRVVLGALDRCMMFGDPGAWLGECTNALAQELARVVADYPKQARVRALSPCYHGNRAGTCGWCALSRDRSDARATASHEPAWDTADCEGE